MNDQDKKPQWNFWLPDADATAGWTNHCFILQFVCDGRGDTPDEAWNDAGMLGKHPEGFVLPESMIAIRGDAEVAYTGDMVISNEANKAVYAILYNGFPPAEVAGNWGLTPEDVQEAMNWIAKHPDATTSPRETIL